jgi:hypothetical protein
MTVLFRPFDLGKWFITGFCAFLAMLGSGGVGFNFGCPGWPGPSGPGGGPPMSGEEILRWVQSNILIVAGLATVGLSLLVLLSLLLIWLQSRGRFMLIHAVAQNHAAVTQPWREFRPEGNSLFRAQIVLMLAGIAATVAIAAITLALCWNGIRTRQFDGSVIFGIVIGGLLLIIATLAFYIARASVNDLVAPAMYARRELFLPAWRAVYAEIIQPHPGQVALFFLLRFLLLIAGGMVAGAAMCVTCCCAAMPYLGTVITLPVHVFMQAYALHFVEQAGAGWQIFPSDGLLCPACRYDLRGNPGAEYCPECGVSLKPQPGTPPQQEPPRA